MVVVVVVDVDANWNVGGGRRFLASQRRRLSINFNVKRTLKKDQKNSGETNFVKNWKILFGQKTYFRGLKSLIELVYKFSI